MNHFILHQVYPHILLETDHYTKTRLLSMVDREASRKLFEWREERCGDFPAARCGISQADASNLNQDL